MNNCKSEPIHGEPMLRDPIDDLSRLVGMIDFTQDAGVKVVLRATIINMIQKHLGIDNENIRERVLKQCAAELMKEAETSTENRSENVTVDVSVVGSDAIKKHIHDVLQEINSTSLNALKNRLDERK